jgi:fatty acid CoA ligase FadD9
MTHTATELTREQRLAERVERLYANDPQFRAASPSAEVTEAAHRPGLRLSEVVGTYLDGYADRPALGQRACEVTRDDATGTATTKMLSGFETITYRELGDRVQALSSAWRSGLPGGFRPGDFVAVLGFTSIDYVVNYVACIRLGAVFVPLQTSSSAAQLAPIVAETTPRVFAVSVESLDTAVDVVTGAPSIERLVVFDYTSDDDGQRDRYEDAGAPGRHRASD